MGAFYATLEYYVLALRDAARTTFSALEQTANQLARPLYQPMFAFPDPGADLLGGTYFAMSASTASHHTYIYIHSNPILSDEIQSSDALIRQRAALAALIWEVDYHSGERPWVDTVEKALGMYNHNRESVIGFVKGKRAYDLLWDVNQKIERRDAPPAEVKKKDRKKKEEEYPF